MILQALDQYYNTLADRGVLSRPGWDDSFRVSFALDLADDGSLKSVQSLLTEQTRGKKAQMLPRTMKVPAHTVRSSGIAANFLCDNATYLLGADEKGKPARARACFGACAELHQKVLSGVDTPAARAVLQFFAHWDPDAAAQHPLLLPRWKELTGNANLIFFYGMRSVAEDPAVCDAWQRWYDTADPDAPTGRCLITGQELPIAATHPMIKGVQGAQSSGAALVSFNAPAFCSYGHEQNFNAPVSTTAAFAYTTALNRLLADREHCRTIGDTTVVCWAEHGDTAYQDLIQLMLNGPSQQGITDEELAGLLKNLTEGKLLSWDDRRLDPDEHFYFLGLAPNAARLSVRFFLHNTFGAFVENIRRHHADIEVVRSVSDRFKLLSVWQLADETANRKAKDRKPSPRLAGELLRAILTGTPYPATLLNGIQLRIRAEREVTPGRAAIIKGYYLRTNISSNKEVFTVQLNEESRYQPYILGRLFYILEALQEEAGSGTKKVKGGSEAENAGAKHGINSTIRDKYFNTASSTPATVFPLLINLGQKHLRKLTAGQKTYYDKQITGLLGMLDESFPARMSLPEQGAFQLGYYHQKQKRYEKKEEKENG